MKDNKQGKSILAARLSGYAASAGALLALAPSVSGQVVSSGPQDIQLSFPDESYQLDMDTDGITDFVFRIRGTSSSYMYSSYLIHSASGYGVIMNALTNLYENSWVDRSTITRYYYTYYGGSYAYWSPIVDGLESGSIVGSSLTNWGNISFPSWDGALGVGAFVSWMGPYYSGYYEVLRGDFIGEEKYIGVRFFIGSERHYGWIRVSMNDHISPMTIVDWAYESTPETAIAIGNSYDTERPIVTLDAGMTETDNPVVLVHVTFNERIFGLEPEDFIVSNGTITNWYTAVQGREFFIEVTAAHFGDVIFGLLHESVSDYSGNLNHAANISWLYRVVGVQNEVADVPLVYPNPVNEMLTVKLPSESDIQLINTAGYEVYRNTSVLTDAIDVSTLPAGMYILIITNERGVTQQKISVN
jgi:hypothetical protein